MPHCIFLPWFFFQVWVETKHNVQEKSLNWTPFYTWRKPMEIPWEALHMEKIFRRNLDINFSAVKFFFCAMETVNKPEVGAFLLCVYFDNKISSSLLMHFTRTDLWQDQSQSAVCEPHMNIRLLQWKMKSLYCRTQICLPQVGGFFLSLLIWCIINQTIDML